MVSRRTYIAAIVGSGATAVYGLVGNPLGSRGADDQKADSDNVHRVQRSATGSTTTEKFRIPPETKTTEVMVEATVPSDCRIYITQSGQRSVTPLADSDEDIQTEHMIQLSGGEYFISAQGGVEDWNVKLTNYLELPSEDQFSDNIPIRESGNSPRVLGPISLGPYPRTKIEFETKGPSESQSTVYLIDGNGQETTLFTIPSQTATTETFFDRLDGRGFIHIVSNSEWEFTLKKDPDFGEESPDEGGQDGYVRPI